MLSTTSGGPPTANWFKNSRNGPTLSGYMNIFAPLVLQLPFLALLLSVVVHLSVRNALSSNSLQQSGTTASPAQSSLELSHTSTLAESGTGSDEGLSWSDQLPSIAKCLVEDAHLYVDGKPATCESLKKRKGTLLEIDQSHCYPSGFSHPNGAAPFAKGKYPITMREGTSDFFILSQFFCNADFYYVRHLARYLPKDRPLTVIDAGANIGLASLLLGQAINLNGEVISFEANPLTYKSMAANTKALGINRPINAAVVNEATARTGENITIAGNPGYFGANRVFHDPKQASNLVSHSVPTMSLSMIKNMAKTGEIDILKLDIEGEEASILSEEESRKVVCTVSCIAAEIHPWGGSREAWKAFLSEGCGPNYEHVVTTGEYELYCLPPKEKSPELPAHFLNMGSRSECGTA